MSTPFSTSELDTISSKLSNAPDLQGAALCNYIFGFNNWSSEIREMRLYYTTEEVSDGKALYSSGASAICRVRLRDGSQRDAMGSGAASGQISKMESIEKAQNKALNNGLQKCVEQFQAGYTDPQCSESTDFSEASLKYFPFKTPLSGTKRKLHQLRNNEMGTALPPVPNYHDTTTTHDVNSSSPSLEDIDTLMQQYDSIGECNVHADDQLTTVSATTSGISSNLTSNSSDLKVHHVRSGKLPTKASLKGQTYPPRPNLQNPFDDSNKK